MTEQYVVRTSLTNTPSRPFVEEIVQLRARVQAAGTSVFTLAILQEWQTEGSLPSTMISQGFSRPGQYAAGQLMIDHKK
jgi:hypothetical protein